jgi:hypothetical protein
MQVLSEEYVAASISPSMREAALDVEGDLLAIESTFGQIGDMFERIELFRRQLEARVRNTIRYAERGGHGLVGRAGDLVRRLDQLISRGRHPNATIEWSLEPLRSPWSEFHHAPSREPRRSVEQQALGDRPTNPLYEIRKQLRLEYIARIAPAPADIRRFLERQVPMAGTREARFIIPQTVDDFLAFDAARRFALTKEVPSEIAQSFDLEFAPHLPPHDSEWLRCANFIVTRHPATAARRRHAQ